MLDKIKVKGNSLKDKGRGRQMRATKYAQRSGYFAVNGS
jgi:hypothetical protein